MKELIHAQEAYKDFYVATQPESGNYGENTSAIMPSIIVEVAFHTNVSDAAALKITRFAPHQ